MSGLATAAVLAATLILTCCAPASIPLPPQRRTFTGPEPKPFGAFARISDPHSEANFVSGLRPEGRWAWTARRAALRYWLPGDGPWRFTFDVYLAGQTLEKNGPVTISCYIDGRLLGKLRGDAPREFKFDEPVPASWVGPGAPVSVVLEADKAWTEPNGTEYAFLLVSAGFLPR